MSNRHITSIGTAWYGRHVVMVHCQVQTNQVIKMDTSEYAPIEPPSPHCAETLARLFSIGYNIISSIAVSHNHVIYLLMK